MNLHSLHRKLWKRKHKKLGKVGYNIFVAQSDSFCSFQNQNLSKYSFYIAHFTFFKQGPIHTWRK